MTHIFLLGSYAPSLINFRGPLIRDLLAAGHRVSVGAPDIPGDVRSALEAMGAMVYETPLERRGTGMRADLAYYRVLKRILLRIRPDALLTYTIKPNIWGAFAAGSAGIPSYAMITGLGYAFTEAGARLSTRQRLTGMAARWLYRAATRRSERVIFQNPDDRDDFIRGGCLVDPAKAAMIDGSGVDMEHYSRAPLPDAPVVLMIARLLAAKGVRDYAAAAFAVRASHPSARFLLVGPFDEGPDSIGREEVEEWVADGLEYLGPTDDVRPVIAQARLYVLPSYREGTPRSVLEAMAMGRPVVTSDAPGCRETVKHGVNGLLVPVRDSRRLAAAIVHLLDNPMEVEAMGQAGYELVALKYDVKQVNRAIMDIMKLSASREDHDDAQK
ncbi:glycosyltransferase family 4 protein [Sphingopyxis sp. DBS4]|uniref:glycosyltransferase family 4 protein n=1 Tax=Sphingopyxis sp. DBS4 TaxID=2968500 RepID=UPI00214B1C70|nr:glycosyltransferase family 4 protein [Sphingopyxis sp. DBS4]